MCNAYKHPLGCNCGWGGVWYGASADNATWLFNRPLYHPRRLGRQNGTFQPISRGYTKPNASCPVCGQSVYFYASPFGGRVFFDDLGPPWPKHPCTDRGVAPATAVAQPIVSHYRLQWLGEVQLAKVGPHTYEIQGVSEGKRYLFHFDADEIVMAEMVRFRPVQHGNIELHILDYNDERRCWVSWQGHARVKQHSATPVSKLKSSVVHQHILQTLHGKGGREASYKQTEAKQQKIATVALHQAGALAPEKLRITPHGLYRCPKCPAHIARKGVIRHLLKVHKTPLSEMPLLPPMRAAEVVNLIRCPVCSANVSPENLAKHRQQKHGGIGMPRRTM